MEKPLYTYISLFSCAGVGCYGFDLAGFHCIATNELSSRRLQIQKYNNKCIREEGYIEGDVTQASVKQRIIDEVTWWKENRGMKNVDVVIATPPCQGMSIFNHKRNSGDIVRNSLVIESLNLVKIIRPKFFIFENVPSFMDTECIVGNEERCSIREAHHRILGESYSFYADTINFKRYGSNSSRTRTLVIGVRQDLGQHISPAELFPNHAEERSLRDTIGDLPALNEMGEICPNDILHSFRSYPERMRSWIVDLREGESAFDNKDPQKRPHKIDKDGNRIEHANKTGDKYKRQVWDKCGMSIHTRNDQLASQNTIHPRDDRVFSIRELMRMMTIPETFAWSEKSYADLNTLPLAEKKSFLKKEEMNIRQCIGEAVPTAVFFSIANNIIKFLSVKHCSDRCVCNIISRHSLENFENLSEFISVKGCKTDNQNELSAATLSRIAELANNKRVENAAYYTGKNTLTEVFQHIPTFEKEEIYILEPAVGAGNFIPFLIKKYSYAKAVHIDVMDTDEKALHIFRQLMNMMDIPDNVTIHVINDDFITHDFGDTRYDLIIGNPPYLKLLTRDEKLIQYRQITKDKAANNLAAFFMMKSLEIADYIAFILPKNILSSSDYASARKVMSKRNIPVIIDFGESGFKGIHIETILMVLNTQKRPGKTYVKSIPKGISMYQRQSYITDNKLPNWVIYRNDSFDRVLDQKRFDVFSVFRDRQITRKMLSDEKGIWVVRSRNIPREGGKLKHVEGYDIFVNPDDIKGYGVMNFLERDDVFLVPNMTYYPRMVRKPKGVITNGSVGILIPKEGVIVSDEDIEYISGNEFEDFYRIARNHATRSLNIDNVSIYYFCIQK
jgi:DNA (cytosine-5)-methyltransferase 1